MGNLSHLNIFNFYPDDPSLENNLTRAFLILLKNNPFIFSNFFELVKKKLKKEVDVFNDITEILFFTQQGSDLSEHACEVIVPIIITEKEVEVKDVREVTPRAGTIADGVICIKPNLAITIEVKRHTGVDWSQLYGHVNLFNDNNLERLDALNITWDEIVKLINKCIVFNEYLFRPNKNYLSGLEGSLINDFIDYVNAYHPQLMPFDRLEYCRENKIAYYKYITHFLTRLNLGEVQENFLEFSSENISVWLKRLYLDIDDELYNFNIRSFPADTTIQSVNFYSNLKIDKLEELINNRWEIVSNLHFSFIGTHLHYGNSEVSPIDYIKYWQNNLSDIRQYHKDEFDRLYSKLLTDKMIDNNDIEELRSHFDKTNRSHINLAPGLALSYKLPVKEALQLEEKKQLLTEFKGIVSKATNII